MHGKRKNKLQKGLKSRPQTSISARLEEVRDLKGIPSIRRLHSILTDPARSPNGKPFEISESAVRNYQYGKDPRGMEREPPYSYLRRVCDVFSDVNPEWLLTGRGQPMRQKTDEGEIGRTRNAICDEFRQLDIDPDRLPAGTDAILDAWAHIAPLLTIPERPDEHGRELTEEESMRLARHLVRLIVAPARSFGIDLANLRGGFLHGGHYVRAQCETITALILANSSILFGSPATWGERNDLLAYLSGESSPNHLYAPYDPESEDPAE